MTTLVFVENVLGSGHVVKLTEDFGDHVVSRDLNPGEHVRLVVSPFKTISVEEAPAAAKDAPKPAMAPNLVSLPKPRILERRAAGAQSASRRTGESRRGARADAGF